MATTSNAIDHFANLEALLEDLIAVGIELVEHRYLPRAFGHFLLILARGHEHLKFTWDGREEVLSLSFATISDSTSKHNWTHDANFSLPGGEAVYAEIGSQTMDMLASNPTFQRTATRPLN